MVGYGPDTDFDGIEDAWETTETGNLDDMDETTDFDQDGFIDLHEFLAQTDPDDTNSLLRFSTVDTDATDACTGMLVFRNELMNQLRLQDFTDDLDFSLQMRCRCAMMGIPNLELPIPYDNRAGDSKLGVVRHGLKFTMRIARERLRSNG